MHLNTRMKRTIAILLLPLIVQQLHNYESTVSAGFIVRSPLHMSLGDNLGQNSSPSRIPPATALSSSTAINNSPFGTLAFVVFKTGRAIGFYFWMFYISCTHNFTYRIFYHTLLAHFKPNLTSTHILPRRIQHITRSTRRQSQLHLEQQHN